MDLARAIERMAANAHAIRALLQKIDLEQTRWRPAPEAWSMIEVVCHLYDEEREDFRARLDFLLHNPTGDVPPTDPEGWVTARNYQARDLPTVLAEFLTERERSLAWLRTLDNPQWQNSIRRGTDLWLHAGDILASWVAHDLLHLRQLIELHYAYHAQQVQPFSPDYAGEW